MKLIKKGNVLIRMNTNFIIKDPNLVNILYELDYQEYDFGYQEYEFRFQKHEID